MKLSVISNTTKPNSEQALKKLHESARKFGIEIVEIDDTTADFIVVLGGDGSVLKASHTMHGTKTPFLNINTGSLGYLTCTDINGLDNALQCLLSGDYTIDKRSTLKAEVYNKSGKRIEGDFFALNDMTIMRSNSGRIVGLELSVDNDTVTTFLCDGLIVATPTGSTAYSLSAGGPIVLPNTKAFIVNVICPHTLTSRPLVLPDTSRIEIKVSREDSELIFSCDGYTSSFMKQGDCVRITKSETQVDFVMLPSQNHFTILSNKLGWSGSSIGNQRRL